jgi:hypothetical protein
MLVARGLGRGGSGSMVAHGMGRRLRTQVGTWLNIDGAQYRKIREAYMRHPTLGYVRLQGLYKKTTDLGWRRVI